MTITKHVNSPVIRPATLQDIDAICCVIGQIAAERKHIALQTAPNRERYAMFLAKGIAVGNAQYVACVHTSVVGWCDITRMERDVYAHRGVVGMGVAAEWRRRGIGRSLLVWAMAHAREQGISRIELEVRADNTSAVSFYSSLGFRDEGDAICALRFVDSFVDLKRMASVEDGRCATFEKQ